jgi:hypothetical protein
VIGLSCPGDGQDRHLGETGELVLAARATASFPGAFPPARVAEIDAVLAARKLGWPGRAAFLARNFPGRSDPEQIDLIDGAVLDNRPFGPALAALAGRPAHREVDRRFVYLDPKPGMPDAGPNRSQPPGFFATILRSLADIPRQQPIRDSLATIEAISARARRLRHIVIGMIPQVDMAIDAAIGMRLLLFSPTMVRLADWRSRMNGEAARQAGFAYGAYGRLKFTIVMERLAAHIAAAGHIDEARVRRVLWLHVRGTGIDEPEQTLGKAGPASAHVLFLRQYDLDFRIRRLRFLIRRVNMAMAGADERTATALGAVKAGIYAILGPHLTRGQANRLDSETRAACAGVANDPAAALAAMAAALDLKALDDSSDAALVALLSTGLPRKLRRDALAAYLGFAFFDIAILPLIADGGTDELDEIKVDRVSPDDCMALAEVGGRQLKGAQFKAFGAFFCRAYREHDYLWGRLHGAERMIDLVVSSLPEAAKPTPEVLAGIRREAFRAIVSTERPHLKGIDETFVALEASLGSN